MKRPTSIVGVATALAVIVGLSACAPAVHGGPRATPSHHRSTPHGTPTPTQAAIPSVRVPLTCSSLYSDAAVTPLIDVPVHSHIDETTPPTNIVAITARQYGNLVCLWGGQDRTDGGYDQNLTIEISPDAATGFNANIHGLETIEGAPTAENTAGDKSEYYCGVQGEWQCSANMLVGTYWVTASIQNLAATVSQPTANSRIQGVLTKVASALASKTALAAWNPPGATLPGFCTEPGSVAQVNAALGTTDFTDAGDDQGLADADSYTQLPGVYTQCTWGTSGSGSNGFTFVSFAMLRGGSWVIAGLAGETDSGNYMLSAFNPTTIPGADSAVSTCSTAGQLCEFMIAIGDVLVSVNMDDPGTAKVNTAIAKLVADIKQS